MKALIFTGRVVIALSIAVVVTAGITILATKTGQPTLITVGGYTGALAGLAFMMFTRRKH